MQVMQINLNDNEISLPNTASTLSQNFDSNLSLNNGRSNNVQLSASSRVESQQAPVKSKIFLSKTLIRCY